MFKLFGFLKTTEESNTREFRVDPADIIRAAIREHERQHGYFNVIDNLVQKLDQEIRVWYEFERRYESTSSFLDAFQEAADNYSFTLQGRGCIDHTIGPDQAGNHNVLHNHGSSQDRKVNCQVSIYDI